MSKHRDRPVYRRGDERVNKPTITIAHRAFTRRKKMRFDAALEILNNQCGAELTTKGRDGQFRSKDTIYPGNDPISPRDKEH